MPEVPGGDSRNKVEWSAEIRLGILAEAEGAAAASAARSFDSIGIPLSQEITVFQHGIDRWIARAELDIAGLAMEPDNAQTRLSYISGHFPEDVLWSSRITDYRGSLDWPPNFWDRRSAEDDFLLEPSVRAVAIVVRNDGVQSGSG